MVARLANVPIDTRNGVGAGGGRVVGWYPIVRFFFSMLLFESFIHIGVRGS